MPGLWNLYLNLAQSMYKVCDLRGVTVVFAENLPNAVEVESTCDGVCLAETYQMETKLMHHAPIHTTMLRSKG